MLRQSAGPSHCTECGGCATCVVILTCFGVLVLLEIAEHKRSAWHCRLMWEVLLPELVLQHRMILQPVSPATARNIEHMSTVQSRISVAHQGLAEMHVHVPPYCTYERLSGFATYLPNVCQHLEQAQMQLA